MTLNSMVVSQAKQNVEIDAIMSTLSSKMANIYEERESATLSDYIEYTLYLICKRFGEKLRFTKQHYYLTFIGSSVKSLLLTELYSLELVCRTASLVAGGCCHTLYTCFEGSIEVQCHQKHYGTKIYHTHCDLMQALLIALAKDQQPSASSATCEPHALHTHAVLCIEEQPSNVALFLNSKLHDQDTE